MTNNGTKAAPFSAKGRYIFRGLDQYAEVYFATSGNDCAEDRAALIAALLNAATKAKPLSEGGRASEVSDAATKNSVSVKLGGKP